MERELAHIAQKRYLDPPSYTESEAMLLTREEIEALDRRPIHYAEAVSLVCDELKCARSSFYRYHRDLLRPFLLGGKQRFCWEDDVLRAIARAKRAQFLDIEPPPWRPRLERSEGE